MRVLPDVSALDRTFDYTVTDEERARVDLGTMVRVELHGRRIGGWIVALDVEPDTSLRLLPVRKIRGLGPTEDLIELADWASWRWAGRRRRFLGAASPERAVTGLPARRPSPPTAGPGRELAAEALSHPVAVLRLPPAVDRAPVALAAAALGNALLLTPTQADAQRLAGRLRRAGVQPALAPDGWSQGRAGATVVGTRAAAWAPMADLAAVVVFDEHDPALKEQATPAWNGRDVAVERARRAGVPCLLVSPTPSLEALDLGPLVAPSRSEERAGWPAVELLDRRKDDPVRGGLFAEGLTRLVRGRQRVVCVLNRTGRSRLLACATCGTLARCEQCDAAVRQLDESALVCARCGTERPVVCPACGSERLKNLRQGVTRAREELEALVGEPVGEVTGSTEQVPDTRVVIGTEAVLHRVAHAEVVVFLDIDQELLAPRPRAAEEAMTLVARAARLVRGRRDGSMGRLVLQTRNPGHDVLQAALLADPQRVAEGERRTRTLLRFPPVSAMARVSGEAAAAFVERLGSPLGIEVLGPQDEAWLVRAADHTALCDALEAVERPPGRLRLEVDPLRW